MKFKHEKNALTNISPSSNYIWSGFLSDLLWLRAGVSTHSLGPHVCIHWFAIAKGYLDLDINFTSDQLKQFSFPFFCSLSLSLSLSFSLSPSHFPLPGTAGVCISLSERATGVSHICVDSLDDHVQQTQHGVFRRVFKFVNQYTLIAS